VALAAAIWWWHWLRQALHGQRSVLWQVYLLAVPVLGGLLTAAGSAAVTLHAAVQWVIGEPDATQAAVQFATLPASLAAMVVGAWAWGYHRLVLGEADERRRGEPERAYEYLAAAVGLVAATAGVTMVFVAAIEAVAPVPLVAVEPRGGNTLALAVTLLVVGAPLWWAFWRRLRTGAGDSAELASPSRRAYLFMLFGITGLAAAISAVVILFVFLRDLLEGALAGTVVYDLRIAIAMVLTAGGVSAYHWTVHQDDRAAAPAAPPRLVRHVLLVSPDGQQLADRIAADTGATVRTWHRLDVAGGEVDADAVAAAILASPHERLLVTIDDDGTVHAIPYEAS